MLYILTLQWTFLPDQVARSKMSMPPRSQVDYRAACFCHRQLIDRGYVCSVCLSSKSGSLILTPLLHTTEPLLTLYCSFLQFPSHLLNLSVGSTPLIKASLHSVCVAKSSVLYLSRVPFKIPGGPLLKKKRKLLS